MSHRAVAAAATGNVSTSMVVFLLGSMSPLIRQELGFSERALGAAITCYFVSSAVLSVSAGRLCQRIGYWRALQVAVVISSTAAFTLGLLSTSWGHVVLAMALAGAGNALVQPASNVALAREVQLSDQGQAFGLKQSAGPSAVFIAGLAVPAVALTVGWRWAFAIIGITSIATWILARGQISRDVSTPVNIDSPDLPAPVLWRLALGIILAVAAAGGLTAFYVESAVAQGHSAAAAGSWLAFGSVASIGVRIIFGRRSDYHPSRHLVSVSWMLIVGAFGVSLLGFSAALPVLALATVLAFGGGWGWPGIYQHGVVHLNPANPGAATGVAMVGVFLGGVIGPVSFGWLIEHGSYRSVWAIAGAALLISAGMNRRLDARIRGLSPL